MAFVPRHPVLYVVGLGDPGDHAWNDFTVQLVASSDPKFSEGRFWAQVKNDSGPPDLVLREIERLIPELQQGFFETFRPSISRASDVKVVVYGRSYGAVLLRDYLSRHPKDHHVSGALLEAGPHRGAEITRLAVLPAALLWGGLGAALGSGQLLYGMLGVVGFMVPWIADHAMGLNFENGGLYALRPGSLYLQNLGQRPLPTDVRYINVIQNCGEIPARALNSLSFNLTEGDGAVSVASQTLDAGVVANFSDLQIEQVRESTFHWTYPEISLPAVREHLIRLLTD